jgi:hypothetical protein
VEELVARHGDVGFLSNIEDRFGLPPWAGRLNRTIYRRIPARLTEKGRVRFAPSEGYRILDREVSPTLSVSRHDLTATDAALVAPLREFFARRAAAQHKPAFLHKFTGWPRVGLIDAALDGVRYVHVVRDGRAVASSWLQMPWWIPDPAAWQWGPLPAAYAEEWDASGRDPVLLAGLAWKMLIDAFAVARVDDARWLEIRYEDVVSQPEHSMRRVAQHLGLSWSGELAEAVRRHPMRASSGRPEVAAKLTASLATHLSGFGYAL